MPLTEVSHFGGAFDFFFYVCRLFYRERVFGVRESEARGTTWSVDALGSFRPRWVHVFEAARSTQGWQEPCLLLGNESVRIGRDRVVQRRLLNLGELNTTQIDRWQRSIEAIEEDGGPPASAF